MSTTNTQVRLAQRPTGLPDDATWSLTTEPVADPAAGEVVVEVQYLSLDPAMRGWMRDVRSYIEPVGIGEVMRAGGVGRVVASADPRYAEGEFVSGMTGAQEYAVLPGDGLLKVDPDVAPLPRYLGALGMTGMTAYFGLLDVGQPQAGETVVVSGAAGATGSMVGQIARVKGCRVVGIAGGAEKCAWLTDELRFDAAVDYRAGNLVRDLRAAAPSGIDVYFDNVGGDVLDAALACLARGARIPLCGAISQYNADGSMRGPANYMSLLVARARMQGFLVFDYASRFREAAAEITGWLASGEVIAREDVVGGGVAGFGEALLKLFRGENTGKLVLQVAGG